MKILQGLEKSPLEILENDLKLSEHFDLIDRSVFKEIAVLERTRKTVDYDRWNQMGAQWLLKTQYKINPLG